MRQAVTDALSNVGPESKGRQSLEEMRRALHHFHDLLEDFGPTPVDESAPSFRLLCHGLDTLREVLSKGSHQLAELYDLPTASAD